MIAIPPRMARDRVPQISEFPYHITNRCVNREHFHCSLDTVWSLLTHHLDYAYFRHGLEVLSFVLMPNHFHLMARSQKFPIGDVMREFLSNSTKDMNRISGRMNQNWGSRYYKCEIDETQYYLTCYKYVYQNPLRAKLVSRVQDWPYSTLRGLLGQSRMMASLKADTILFNPRFSPQELNWLNTLYDEDHYLELKKGLQKKKFSLPHKSSIKSLIQSGQRV